MAETLILWSHALAAFLFAALALWAARRDAERTPRWPLVAVLGATAIWALAVAGLGGTDPATRLVDGLRNLAMLALMVALHRHASGRAPVGVAPVYGVVAIVVAIGTLLQLAAVARLGDDMAVEMVNAAILLRMMVAVAALVLVQNLYATQARGDVRLLCAALGLIWLADLNLAAAAYLSGTWPVQLIVIRGLAIIAAAALVAVALQRSERGPVQVSRTIAYQSLSLIAIGGYFALLVLVISGLSAIGGTHARIYQTAFVFGSTAAVLTLVGSPWLRAWVRVKIAKHLFRHRYDYRAEWIRFTGTLGAPEDAAPLDQRIVRAVAEMTESPAGLLLVPDGEGLGIGAGWNWPQPPNAGTDSAFVAHLAMGDRIVELDPLRRGGGDAAEVAIMPQWMLDDPDGWAVVPLPHLGRLVGAILLARPAVDRALDWEDFDLLRIAGRQAATYLAEARAQQALAQAQRFDEFNRRFAFIVHDIKNLVSGLSLVAHNAERHADNPAFRADMVATLQDSAAKLNALLARLSAGSRGPAEPPVTIELLPLVERIAIAHRATRPVIAQGDRSIVARADPARLEQLLSHLVRNAIEASDASEPVTVAVDGSGGEVSVSVIDRGSGMSPAFVRDQLFQPFVSTKPGGFGIGAFEARQLAEAMGGRIEVDSREGEGTRFRVVLPGAVAPRLGIAA